MTRGIAIRHAWLQKHPSPTTDRGEFHWHPEDGDSELRASFVERASGIDAPAILWQLEPGRVAWAQCFGATAPSDRRRYTGIVLAIASADGAEPHELLGALTVPVAAPFSAAPPATKLATSTLPDAPRLARAVLGGGVVGTSEVDAVSPRALAALERLVPRELRTSVRTATVVARAASTTARDLPAELLVGAAAGNATQLRAWRLLCELATATRRSLDAICDELAILWADGALTAEERARLAHGGDFASLLNAWGRGRLDGSATADTLAMRLADAVALRALARLLDGDDPALAIAEVRWHALLPADRRAEIVSALVTRTPSLLPVLGSLGGAHA